MVRAARREDLPAVRELERAAGGAFRDLGMAAVAEDEPPTISVLAAYAALTLTTYANVPWNAPYYERLGFRIMTVDQITEGLRRIREHEQARGLAKWPRVTMRRPVGS